MVLGCFLVVTPLVSTLPFAFLPHTLHGVPSVGVAFFPYLLTPALTDLLPIYKSKFLGMDSEKQITQL